jgi:hypothetical protein
MATLEQRDAYAQRFREAQEMRDKDRVWRLLSGNDPEQRHAPEVTK